MDNPLIAKIKRDPEDNLKKHIVDYVGTLYDEEEVTIEMIATVLASEFPEFLFTYAQENFMRGYETGVEDSILFEESENNNEPAE